MDNRYPKFAKATTVASRKVSAEKFDILATKAGFTAEMLRKSGDCPKMTLPPNVPLIRLPVEMMEDPFKGLPPMNAEVEYENLHKSFYGRIRRILCEQPNAQAETLPAELRPTTQVEAPERATPKTAGVKTSHMRVEMMGPRRSVKIQVTKNSVDAVVKFPEAK